MESKENFINTGQLLVPNEMLNHSSNKINIAYIGFGSNIENPIGQIIKAYEYLKNHQDILEIDISSLYESKPLGNLNQDNFINAVAKISYRHDYNKLHDLLRNIEKNHKKKILDIWGPRTLDLDLLSYNNMIIKTKKLTIPHPGVPFRNFVIIPWYELDPDFILPNNLKISELYENTDKNIRKIKSI